MFQMSLVNIISSKIIIKIDTGKNIGLESEKKIPGAEQKNKITRTLDPY